MIYSKTADLRASLWNLISYVLETRVDNKALFFRIPVLESVRDLQAQRISLFALLFRLLCALEFKYFLC